MNAYDECVQAMLSNDIDRVRAYVESGVVDVNSITDERMCLLFEVMCSTMNNKVMALEMLFDIGARADVRGRNGWTAIHACVFWGDVAQLEVILKHVDDVDLRTLVDHNSTPLMDAVTVGKLDMVERLLRSGADSRAQNFENEDARQIAKRHGFHSIVAVIDEWRTRKVG